MKLQHNACMCICGFRNGIYTIDVVDSGGVGISSSEKLKLLAISIYFITLPLIKKVYSSYSFIEIISGLSNSKTNLGNLLMYSRTGRIHNCNLWGESDFRTVVCKTQL